MGHGQAGGNDRGKEGRTGKDRLQEDGGSPRDRKAHRGLRGDAFHLGVLLEEQQVRRDFTTALSAQRDITNTNYVTLRFRKTKKKNRCFVSCLLFFPYVSVLKERKRSASQECQVFYAHSSESTKSNTTEMKTYRTQASMMAKMD